MTKLFRIVYCSKNTMPGAAEMMASEIDSILAISRRNNARDGVSGGLLFSRNSFAQVLEGPAAAVEAAFERIQCDERHTEVTVIQSETIKARDFPGWSMAYSGVQPEHSAGPAIAKAFSDTSKGGDEVLDLLRGIVHREAEWLAPIG